LAPPVRPFAAGSLRISPNGNMYLFGGLEPNLTSLGGISYQTSS
jgi:hypothetical protein